MDGTRENHDLYFVNALPAEGRYGVSAPMGSGCLYVFHLMCSYIYDLLLSEGKIVRC